jgi:hypothetical protein
MPAISPATKQAHARSAPDKALRSIAGPASNPGFEMNPMFEIPDFVMPRAKAAASSCGFEVPTKV